MTSYTLTNLITNGSFENALTGWTTDSGSPASSTTYHKFGSKTAFLQAEYDSSREDHIHQTYTSTANHIYYASAWAYNTAGDPGIALLGLGNGSTRNDSQTSANVTWTFLSTTYTPSSTTLILDLYSTTLLTGGAVSYVYFDGVVLLDLTSIFGAGNEPTKTEMDEIVKGVGGYWDTTSSVNRVELNLRNLISNGNFETYLSGWETSNATRSTTYKKYGSYGVKFALASGGSGYVRQYVSATATHVYYITAWGKVYDANANLRLHMSGTYAETTSTTSSRISMEYTAQLTQNYYVSAEGDASTGTDSAAYVDGIMVIDLTAAFGSGNEPSVSEMDSLLSHIRNPAQYYEFGFWDGNNNSITTCQPGWKNLLYDPSFETDLDGWSQTKSYGNETIEIDNYPMLIGSTYITQAQATTYGLGTHGLRLYGMGATYATEAKLYKTSTSWTTGYYYLTCRAFEHVTSSSSNVKLGITYGGYSGYTDVVELSSTGFNRAAVIGGGGTVSTTIYFDGNGVSGDSFEAGIDGAIMIDLTQAFSWTFDQSDTADFKGAMEHVLNTLGFWASIPGTPTLNSVTPGYVGSTPNVTLAWTNGTPAGTSTKIYRKTGSGGTYALIATDTDGSPYVDSTVSGGSTYYYKIKSSSDAGSSADSNELYTTAYYLPLAPGTPNGTQTASGSSPAISVAWTAPTNTNNLSITTYKLYGSTTSGFTPGSGNLLQTANSLSYLHVLGVQNQTWYYKVLAVNAMGDGAISSQGSGVSGHTPTAPTISSATQTNQGSSPAISIAWSTSPDIGGSAVTGYKLYADTDSAFGSPDLIYSGTSRSYTYSGLPLGGTYYFKVLAINAIGDGSLSSQLSGVAGNIPSQVTGLTATATAYSGLPAVQLNWSAATANTNTRMTYKIYIYDGSDYIYHAAVTAPTVTYTVQSLNPATLYSFKVEANNALGAGLKSSAASVVTLAPPTVPSNYTLRLYNRNAVLTWEAPNYNGGTALTGYKIYKGVNTSTLTLDTTVSPSLYTYSEAVSPGNTYYFAVSATNGMEGPQTTVLSFVVPSLPTPPSTLTVRLIEGVPVLSWTEPTSTGGGEITKYHIYCGTSTDPTTLVCTTDGINSEAVHSGATVGTTYYYRLKAENEGGVSTTYSVNASTEAGTDNWVVSLNNVITNGSFDLDVGIDGWEHANEGYSIIPAPSGMFYENALRLDNTRLYRDIEIKPGHTVLATTKGYRSSVSGTPTLSLYNYGESFTTSLGDANFTGSSPARGYIAYNILSTNRETLDSDSAIGIRYVLNSNGTSVVAVFDGAMLIDLSETYGHGAVFSTSSGWSTIISNMIDGFLGGYWEGGFTQPKLVNGALRGRPKTKLTIRGAATKRGRMGFYFKDNQGVNLFRNRWWFTNDIPVGADYSVMMTMISDPTNIHTYVTVPDPYQDDPEPFPGPGYEDGWPVYYNSTTGQNLPIMAIDPVIYMEEDLIGGKTSIEVYTYPARFLAYDANLNLSAYWSEVNVTIGRDEDLEGFGTLMVTSDYTINLRFSTLTQTSVSSSPFTPTADKYMSLNFLINSWFVGDNPPAEKEDIGKQAPYFRIPVYFGDTLASVKERIDNGQPTVLSGKPVICSSLRVQINDYFNKIAQSTGLFTENSFNVETSIQSADQTNTMYDILKVRIFTSNEEIQHSMSCYGYQTTDFYVTSVCNSYYISDNIFELRSYYDMYGIDKPISGSNASSDYTPLAYGFQFSLDYITDYSEIESSPIDLTPIPGQSSAKAIGIDTTGCSRVISINGIRVDNSNIWTFHVPWQENGESRGIIYTGTSNWGWVKFMKAILGTFQMTSGPYRLIMMTVPSTSQMQYFPTRDGTYQYSDGTYVLLAGWEDMCYVMIDSFTYSRSEDMFNAIQYSLQLKRTAPLVSNG